MNSKKSKASDAHRLRLDLMDKFNLGDNHVELSNLSIYCTWKNIKKSYRNNKFKTTGTARDVEFELLDGSYSIF